MKARISIVGTALFLLAAPSLAAAAPTQGSFWASEANVLRSLEDPALLSLRAGAVPARASIGDSEREALCAAQARSLDLGSMRGGSIDLSDHDFKLIAIVLAVVLILVII